MTIAQAEVAIKFTTIPQIRRLPQSRVAFKLKTPAGLVFNINIKEKTWNKAEAFMREHTNWVGNVKGSLETSSKFGLEIANAGLQVYEKKGKS